VVPAPLLVDAIITVHADILTLFVRALHGESFMTDKERFLRRFPSPDAAAAGDVCCLMEEHREKAIVLHRALMAGRRSLQLF